jgi:hypothetical protein
LLYCPNLLLRLPLLIDPHCYCCVPRALGLSARTTMSSTTVVRRPNMASRARKLVGAPFDQQRSAAIVLQRWRRFTNARKHYVQLRTQMRRRFLIAQEIATSEQSYVANLRVLTGVRHTRTTLQRYNTATSRERDTETERRTLQYDASTWYLSHQL